MAVVAHVGHWTTSLIYIAPLILVAMGLVWSSTSESSSSRRPDRRPARLGRVVMVGRYVEASWKRQTAAEGSRPSRSGALISQNA